MKKGKCSEIMFFFEPNDLFPLNRIVNNLGRTIGSLEKPNNCLSFEKFLYLDYLEGSMFGFNKIY